MAKPGDQPTPATSDEIANLRKELRGMEDRLMHAIDQARGQAFKTERNVTANVEELRKDLDSLKRE